MEAVQNNSIPGDISGIMAEIKRIVDRAVDVRDYMTAEECADYLHVSKAWLYSLANDNEIPHSRLRGKIVFIRSEVDKWVDRNHIKTNEEISAIANTKILTRKLHTR